MHTNRLIVPLLLLSLSFAAYGQSASWQVKPEYDSATAISPSLIKVEKGGHFGVIDINGNEVVKCVYDQITGFAETKCLLLGPSWELRGILDAQGDVTSVPGGMFVNSEYPYFSEAMLAFSTEKKNWGYLDSDGNVLIQAKYKQARPVISGIASVVTDQYAFHIDRKGNVLFKGANNYLRFTSSFTVDPKTQKKVSVVCDQNNKVFIRDISGNRTTDLGELRNWNAEYRRMITSKCVIDFNEIFQIATVTKSSESPVNYEVKTIDTYVYSQAGISSVSTAGGFNLSLNGTEILPGQFDSQVIPISPTAAIACKNGKYGLLKISSSAAPLLSFRESVLVYDHHVPVTVTGQMASSSDVQRVRLTDNQGNLVFDGRADNGSFMFNLLPNSLESHGVITLRAEVDSDGLVTPGSQMSITYNHSDCFSINLPAKVKVDNNGSGPFVLHISNNSTMPSDECEILVDGKLKQRVRFTPGQTIGINVSKTVDLGVEDRVARSVSVTIKEKGCPEKKVSGQIMFDRF